MLAAYAVLSSLSGASSVFRTSKNEDPQLIKIAVGPCCSQGVYFANPRNLRFLKKLEEENDKAVMRG